MLISIAEAEQRYKVSRNTLHRRIEDGTLTRHTDADHATKMVDTDEIAKLWPRREHTAHDATIRPTLDEPFVLPAGMAEHLVPHPSQLYAALERALQAPLLPRLFNRSGK